MKVDAARRKLLIVDERDLEEGRLAGFPSCCVEWFAFVWAPVCMYLMFSGEGDATALRAAARMLRGATTAGYIQCPRCRGTS